MSLVKRIDNLEQKIALTLRRSGIAIQHLFGVAHQIMGVIIPAECSGVGGLCNDDLFAVAF